MFAMTTDSNSEIHVDAGTARHAAWSSEGETARLAKFARETRYADLPLSTRHAARRAFVNIVGCCLGGATHEIVETAAAALLPLAGSKAASLIGRRERADVVTAALLNGLASAAYSFDDTHAEAILHPTGAVTVALLALAEQRTTGGEDFINALTIGVDVASRVSKAVSTPPARGDVGWSQTGIAAGIGAAAAAARILGLGEAESTAALSIAALQGSGFRVAHGTMAGSLIMGQAGQTGLRATLLARHGMDAPRAVLEGRYGFTSLFAVEPHMPYLTEDLGIRFEVERLGFKPYPCGVVIHAALDAALAWRASSDAPPASIRRVQLRVHPSGVELGFRRHPANPLEAKVSLCHWVAGALVRGCATLAEGTRAAIDDPQIARLRELIELEGDPQLAGDAASMTIVAGGEQRRIDIAHCKGSMAQPMSDDDLSAKFMGQAQTQLPPAQAAELLGKCWAVERQPSVAELVRLARAGASP
jgi:2-methylcitrate dehydratase PrpD